jgi:hypothetical protein
MKKMATKVRHITGWSGNAILYKLNTPMADGYGKKTSFVIVSAVVVPFGGGPETYIFPATEDGKAINMLDMDGSYRGGLDHKEALERAGYEVGEGA